MAGFVGVGHICDIPWQNQACLGRLMNGDTGKNQSEGDFFGKCVFCI